MEQPAREWVVLATLTVVIMAAWPGHASAAGQGTAKPAAHAGQAGAGDKTPSAPMTEALQGTLVRWSAPGTTRCGMDGRTWKAIQETCYYPIDLERKPGVVVVTRHGAGPVARSRIKVLGASYGSQSIALGDIPQAHPSPADLRRNERERAGVNKLWARPDGPARFTLPLDPPVTPLPAGKGFGSLWVFDTTPETSELHSGSDFAVAAGAPVAAASDGVVLMADDLFFSGQSVFLDHGDGLITMYFHLSDIQVRAGDEVKKGQRLGLAGSTGRATGPHLHMGARWHGARFDPVLLLGDPAKIVAIGDR